MESNQAGKDLTRNHAKDHIPDNTRNLIDKGFFGGYDGSAETGASPLSKTRVNA